MAAVAPPGSESMSQITAITDAMGRLEPNHQTAVEFEQWEARFEEQVQEMLALQTSLLHVSAVSFSPVASGRTQSVARSPEASIKLSGLDITDLTPPPKSHPQDPSEAAADAVFDSLDKNGDGVIDRSEWLRATQLPAGAQSQGSELGGGGPAAFLSSAYLKASDQDSQGIRGLSSVFTPDPMQSSMGKLTSDLEGLLDMRAEVLMDIQRFTQQLSRGPADSSAGGTSRVKSQLHDSWGALKRVDSQIASISIYK